MSDYTNTYANENSYMAFRYMEYDFVIPLSDIVRVEAKAPEKLMLLPGVNNACCYIISGVGEKMFALGADEIYGLANIPISCQYELPHETKTSDNPWIFGVAYLKDTAKMAFMLDSHVLVKQLYNKKEGSRV